MKITIIALGIMKRGVEQQLLDKYQKRLPWHLQVIEKEVKKIKKNQLKEQEGVLILAEIPKGSYVIALDERGKQFKSLVFADKIRDYQNRGHSHLCFIIGGADGLSDSVRQRADELISFGKMTFPHMLVRGLLCEQLYRCFTILEGHPYHRE